MKQIYVVGIGPGAYEKMTMEAMEALKASDVIVGYTVYVDLVKEYFPDKEMLTTPMRREEERCRMALEEASRGKTVAMICSGDAGVYGMAGLMLEMGREYPDCSIEVVPGVTAALAGAAVLGAPLIHDFAVISLSDLLTPWETIEKRLACAADGDFSICIYNPSSKKRNDYLQKACRILLKYRSPETVCGIVRNIGRDGQSSQVMTLGELEYLETDMFTTVFVGNSRTQKLGHRMVTPRGYRFEGRKGILVVSFGTSHPDTRKKTIDAVEKELAAAYPEYRVYRAWTSGMIIRKLKERDGYHVNTVTEALEQMKADGIRELVVQPTHVINGFENEQMIAEVSGAAEDFEKVSCGAPLLTTSEDGEAVIRVLMEEFGTLNEDTALVFLGHGTTHYANTVYAALDYQMKDMGYRNAYIGTVEAYPSMESLKRRIEEGGYKKVILAPFMIVAGEHAKHDMAGDDPQSWRCQFEDMGCQVECVFRGLGEYEGIRRLLAEHAREAMEKGAE